MARAPFPTLISAVDGDVQISHLPMLCEPSAGACGRLTGHLARANPHWHLLERGRHLAVFQGPHRHISPAWYRQHPSVPTWNYAVVHARGTCKVVDDPARLHTLTAAMTARFERENGTTRTLPDDEGYLASMFAQIVGFELTIESLQGKYKLSQNRPAADREQVLAALRASTSRYDRELLDLMALPTPKVWAHQRYAPRRRRRHTSDAIHAVDVGAPAIRFTP